MATPIKLNCCSLKKSRTKKLGQKARSSLPPLTMLIIGWRFPHFVGKRNILQHWLGGMGDTWSSSSVPTTFGRDCRFNLGSFLPSVLSRMHTSRYSQRLTNLDKVWSKISPSLCRYQHSFSHRSLRVVDCTVLFFSKWFLLIFHMFGNTVAKESRNPNCRQEGQLKHKEV